MRRLFRRSVLWLLPVVVIPVIVLLVMQYQTLRKLEQTTASAEQNRMRNALSAVTQEVEAYYRRAALAALDVEPAMLADAARFGGHLAANRVGGTRTYFTGSFTTQGAHMEWFDGKGKVAPLPPQPEREAVKLAAVSWWHAHKLQRVVPKPELDVDERDPRNRIILMPITDESMHVVGVTGLVLDEQLAKAHITTLGVGVMHPGTRMPTELALRVGTRFPKMADGRDFITQSLGFVFTDWRIGVRDACASPEEIAACNFRINMLWTGGAGVMLLGGVFLAISGVFKQARLSQMKSDFVSNVSHELRTPLSSIRVFGEYMRLGRVQKEEKIRQYGEYIEVESRRLTQLINNILDFSKIESMEKKYRFAETDVVELVEQTVEALAMPLRDQGFVLRYHAPEVAVPAAHVDRDALAQVIVNLVDNAVKYSGERKEADVSVSAGDGVLRIAVHDRGIGISPSEQKKIFEKFYRVGSGLVHDVKGSGLGLAIVKHVVKAHGGRVEVTSAPGEGSTFTIILPAARGESVPIPGNTEFA
ncbi:MAG TPA: HAMP domain-containing sensor histidine kinase [Thermoanaerobaculia bacterium]